MLKLYEDTRQIPVLTYTTEYEGSESEDEAEDEDRSAGEMFAAKPAIRMN